MQTDHDLSNCPAMRALEALTPGGSEFYNNPANCARWVAGRHSSQRQLLIRITQERNQAREAHNGTTD